MQYISGIWMDNSGTPVGDSSVKFAKAQIEWAKQIGSPVWGWSACDNPDGGYLGWGGLVDPVVTPHASVLAVEHFPHEVVENLQALEKLGVRSTSDGFFDSVNWKTGKVSKHFLVLDQGMVFLSLANYLDNGIVRKWFQAAKAVKNARKSLPDYHRN